MSGSRLSFPFVLSALLAFAVAACSTDTSPGGETGGLSLELVLADDVTINSVDWRITGNGMDMSDSINVSAPGSTASVEVFGLPRGAEDYTIELEAVSVDESVTCRGSEPFNVEARETTNVMVILHCKLPQRLGAVRVNGKFNICAELAKAVVSPLQTSVGNDIDLSAIGVDRDNDPITYSWTSTGGTIDDTSAAVTTYTCVDVGDHLVNISVTDNDEACDMAEWTIPVTCVPGDGFECINDEGCDAGEICVDNVCVLDIECNMNDDCDAGEICVDNVCVPDIECTMNEDCDPGEICVDNVCVADLECTMNDDCDSGEICVDTVCVSDPDIFCDEGLCATDADLKAECVQAFLICLEENPDANDDECVIASLLICKEPDPDCVNDTQCAGDLVCVDNACVECRDADQCPSGGECMVATCQSGSCGLANDDDGASCGDGGMCVEGACIEDEPAQTSTYDIQCTTALSANPFVLALNITIDPDGQYADTSPLSTVFTSVQSDVSLSEAVIVGLLESGVLVGPPFIATVNSGFVNADIAGGAIGSCPGGIGGCTSGPIPLTLVGTDGVTPLPEVIDLETDYDGNTIPGPLTLPSVDAIIPITPVPGASTVDYTLNDWQLSVTADTLFGPLTLIFPAPACSGGLVITELTVASFPVN